MTSEGTQSTRTLEFLAWVEVHKKGLVIGLVAMLLVGSAIATAQWMARQKEHTASSALLELQLRNQMNPAGGEPSVSDYQALAERHAGTRAAARAQLLAAELLFQEGNPEEARRAFEQVEPLLKDDGLRAVAAYGLATSLETLGQVEEARQAYLRVTVEHATSAVAGQARLALAGLLEQRGDWSEALRAYGELTNAVGSPWGDQARQRHAELLLQHPELAPAVQPPVSGVSGDAAGSAAAAAVTSPPSSLAE